MDRSAQSFELDAARLRPQNGGKENDMTDTIQSRLAALGLELPDVAGPAANYVSTGRSGDLLSISGQVSRTASGDVLSGTLGATCTTEDGTRAAEVAALNVIARIAAWTGESVGAVRRIVRLGVFVAATPDFKEHSKVANGASDLMVAIFGDAGCHSRSAIGVSSLPMGAAVEVEALVELEPGA
jgi:enamine deaminase RidA (YjgF/YER057c/UK114 family)